jgi:TolB protein
MGSTDFRNPTSEAARRPDNRRRTARGYAMKLRYIVVALLLALAHTAGALEPKTGRFVCQCFFHSYHLYLTDADGKNERALLPGTGSNYNASFSADGRWVIFTSDRSGTANLYRVHRDGTGLERLTRDNSFDDQGTLSPDGKTLAFVSTRASGFPNLWLLDLATGRTRNLTHSSSGNFRPSWSPDGKWLAFSSDRDTALIRYKRSTGGQAWEWMQLTAVYVVRKDGGGLRRLTPLDQIAGTPKWSPDGHQLAYYQVSDVEERHEERGGGHARIMVMDLETGATRALPISDVFDESPQFLSNTEIGYLSELPAKGEFLHRLAYSSERLGTPLAMRSPSWSPDGTAVVFHRLEDSKLPRGARLPTQDTRYELIAGPPFDTSEVVAFSSGGDHFFYSSFAPEDGSNRIKAGSLTGPLGKTIFDTGDPKRRVSFLSLSPDEREFAIEVGRNMERPPLPAQIAFIGADGSPRELKVGGNDSNGFPSYAPDGKSIVYRVLGKEQGLRILSLQDRKIRVLTNGWDNFPAWSRHGDRIAFTRFENNFFEIYSVRPDGSGLQQLTHSRGTDSHPVWSPDGQWLAFVSGRHGFKDESIFSDANQPYGEVFVMRYDGSDVRQVTDNRYEELVLAWLPD